MTEKNVSTLGDITLQDIEAFDRVLDYCAEAKWIAFNEHDRLNVKYRTSNILLWNLGAVQHRVITPKMDILLYDEVTRKVVVMCTSDIPAGYIFIRRCYSGEAHLFERIE